MKTGLSAVSMAVLTGMAGAASAATTTITTGSQFTVFDPSGSGRSTEMSLVSGDITWAFSTGLFDGVDVNTIGGLIGALNVGNVTVTPAGPAWTDATPAETMLDGIRISSTVKAPVTSVSLDNVTGAFQVVGSAGGALQTGSSIPGTLTGGSASVTNLRFDLANGNVVADLVGIKLPVGTKVTADYNLPNTILWTFDKTTVTGPTAIRPDLLAADPVAAMTAAGFQVQTQNGQIQFVAETVITGLKVTTTGFNFFKNSLGLLSTGVNALTAVNNDLVDPDTGAFVGVGGYGTVTSRLVFTPAVPEPSTYALMGLGLVGLTFVVRRRHATVKTA